MAKLSEPRRKPRLPLSQERVFRAAIAVADKDGVESVTMRRLGRELGVDPMSLYHHLASKDEVVDGMLDHLVSEIEVPSGAGNWRAAIRNRAMSARTLVQRHRWFSRLIASRRIMSPAMLRNMDSVTASLREGGFSHEMAHHAVHVLGSRILGFTQELLDEDDLGPAFAKALLRELRDGKYPALAEVMADIRHDGDAEFEFGLDLILDGLERARDGMVSGNGTDATSGE